jgi:hypothetical protein
MTSGAHHDAEARDDAPPVGAAASLQLSPADGYESGLFPDAKHAHESWKRLQHLHQYLKPADVFLVNYLRALYRGCVPVCPAKPFIPGGSLFFSGAHIRVPHDGGRVYHDLLSIPGLVKGVRLKTSHKVGPPDPDRPSPMEIRFNSLGVVLVGVGALLGKDSPSERCEQLKSCGTEEHTWLQSENAHHLSPAHWVDYLVHVATGHKQRGHLGTSIYSEKPPQCNPLIFRAQKIADLPRWPGGAGA